MSKYRIPYGDRRPVRAQHSTDSFWLVNKKVQRQVVAARSTIRNYIDHQCFFQVDTWTRPVEDLTVFLADNLAAKSLTSNA